MDAAELKALRQEYQMPQWQFADRMGLPVRTYEDLEAGKVTLRPIHEKAAYYACIVIAAERRGYDDLPIALRELVANAARGAPPRRK